MHVTHGMCFQMHTFSYLYCTILQSTKIKLQHLLHSLTIFCLRCPRYWSQNRALHKDDWSRAPHGCQTHSFSYCDIKTTKSFSAITQQQQNKPPSTLSACSQAQYVWKPHAAFATIEQEAVLTAHHRCQSAVTCHRLALELSWFKGETYSSNISQREIMTKQTANWSHISLFSKSNFHFLLLTCFGWKPLSNKLLHKYVQKYKITKITEYTTFTQKYAACIT